MKYFYTLCLILIVTAGYSQTRWSFEFQNGIVYSLHLPLTIVQEGHPDIKINKAEFYSEPLKSPPYWNIRISRWIKRMSFELEFVHHKFYLENKPQEVQRFGISHGYNMLFINHSREWGKFIVRAGIGTNFIHAESTIRGMTYEEGSGFDLEGHRVRGLSVNLTFARQFKLNKTFFINTEAKVHGSVAEAPVVNGYARVNIIVLQLTVGPGVCWRVKNETEKARNGER